MPLLFTKFTWMFYHDLLRSVTYHNKPNSVFAFPVHIQNKTLSINIAIESYVLKIALEIKNLSHQLLEFPRSLWLRHVQEWLGLPTRNNILLANVKVIKSFSVSWNIWIWKILNNLLFAQNTNIWQTKANFTPAVGFNSQ